MNNIEKLEACYKKFTKDILKFLPEGITEVDIVPAARNDLLDLDQEVAKDDDALTRYFHVIETDEKNYVGE